MKSETVTTSQSMSQSLFYMVEYVNVTVIRLQLSRIIFAFFLFASSVKREQSFRFSRVAWFSFL